MAGFTSEPAAPNPHSLDKVPGRLLWLGAVLGATGVLFGAFGAHSLARFAPSANLDTWRTAVLYHLIHAIALLALALYRRQGLDTNPWIARAIYCWALGVLLFSGSLYGLSMAAGSQMSQVLGPVLGPTTPLGGLLMIAGWLCLVPIARTSPRLH